jgi:hypothetical protein
VVGVETTRLGCDGDTLPSGAAKLIDVVTPGRGGRGGGFIDADTTLAGCASTTDCGLKGKAGGGGSAAAAAKDVAPLPCPFTSLLDTTEWCTGGGSNAIGPALFLFIEDIFGAAAFVGRFGSTGGGSSCSGLLGGLLNGDFSGEA